VIGAPVLNLTGLQTKATWNNIAIGPGESEVKQEKYAALADAIYKKCDAVDGVADGLIENPLRCDFDPAKDLPKCAAGRDDKNCFTSQQIAGLKKVYDGPRNSAGKQLFPGMPVGSEAMALDARTGSIRSGWDGSLANSFALSDSFMKYMAFDPAPGPAWNYRSFDFDKDLDRMTATGLRINATIPDLTAVKMRGAKIVHYHGWADPGVTPKMSVEYYEAAKKTMGAKETEDFYRFFPVPGMFHCGGGPGCGNVDWLSAVSNWVEKGVAPAMVVGAHVEKRKTTRTRPICMWPQVAQYKGSGSVDAAENFNCVMTN
jgi:feruloyl esterase